MNRPDRSLISAIFSAIQPPEAETFAAPGMAVNISLRKTLNEKGRF
jgi:hypothetical protein